MNHLMIVRKYLKEKGNLRDLSPTGLPFITISREAGAGGHMLAHLITTDFFKAARTESVFEGWHVFDKELCEVVAEDPLLKTSMEELMAERYRSEFHEFIEGLITGQSRQYVLLKKTFEVVRILAALGKVIIVGRAAGFVTRDLTTGINLRLVAPEASRVKWIMRKFKVERPAAERLVQKQDRERKRMVANFFSRDVADPLNYHAVFNSEAVPPHSISHMLMEMIRGMEAARVKAATGT